MVALAENKILKGGAAGPAGDTTILNADFSTPASGTQPLVNNLYQAMTLDAVTGLYYERNRNYSPSLGTWISQDPAGYINGANTYQFVASNPVGKVDAAGLAGAIPRTPTMGGESGYPSAASQAFAGWGKWLEGLLAAAFSKAAEQTGQTSNLIQTTGAADEMSTKHQFDSDAGAFIGGFCLGAFDYVLYPPPPTLAVKYSGDPYDPYGPQGPSYAPPDPVMANGQPLGFW
jgi:RHS repeat-associated protein